MTTIGPIGSSVGSAHLEVLKRAEHALQTEKPDTAFTERMTNAIADVADAQSKSMELTRAYEYAMAEHPPTSNPTRFKGEIKE